MRHPERSRLRILLLIQQVETPDDRRTRVGDQGEGDLPGLRKRLERAGRIVADGDKPKALRDDLFMTALQLAQLRLAVRSPIGGTKEHQHQAVGTARGVEGLALAELIDAVERGNGVADLRPDRRRIDPRRRLRAADGYEGDRHDDDERRSGTRKPAFTY